MSLRRLRHLPKLLAVVALASCLVHCGHDTPEQPGWSGSRADRLRARLEREAGGRWVVTGDPKADDVRFVAPVDGYPVKDSTPEKTVRAFLRAYGAELGHPVGEAELPVDRVEPNGQLSVVRFSLVDPKTKLPYLDRRPVASVKPDGSLLTMMPTVPTSEATVAPPRLSIADARAKARAHLAASCALDPASIPDETRSSTGIVVDGVDHPRAVHALSFALDDERCGSTEVRVDAATGEVVQAVPLDLHMWAKNRGARYYYTRNTSVPPEDDEKTLSVRASGGAYELVSTDGPVEVRTVVEGANRTRTPVRSSTPSGFDSDASSPGAGAAVDLHHGLFTAYDWFNKTFDWTWPKHFNGGVIEGVAHASINKPFFDSVTSRFNFGDGGGVQPTPQGACKTHPTGSDRANPLGYDERICLFLPFAASIGMVGHEMAHSTMRSAYSWRSANEGGAVQESIADVLGITLEHDKRGGDTWTTMFATSGRYGYAARSAVNPVVSRTSDMKACPEGPSEENDRCGIHLNSGIGTHAWYLMTFGGVHQLSRVSVETSSALGIDAAARLWFVSARAGYGDMGFLSFALQEASMAGVTWGASSPQRQAVVCAWTAVEVIPEGLSIFLLGRSCPTKAPTKAEATGCDRVRDGLVCSPESPRLAYVCKNGQIYGAQVCEAANTVCTPNWDYSARTKADGSLDCEVTVQGSSR